MSRLALIAALSLALACSNTEPTHHTLTPHAHAQPPPTPHTTPPPATTMDPQLFQQAQAAFRQHAARALRAQPDQLKGARHDPQIADPTKFNNNIKRLEAYTDGKTRVRGWALPDGAFATPDHHLERLLQPDLPDARLLAEELAWATGPLHRLHTPLQPNANRLSWEDRDGARSLSFILDHRQPGPGGAGGGPANLSRWTLTFKDGAASLSHKPWTP